MRVVVSLNIRGKAGQRRLRESTKLAILASCLRMCGAEATIVAPPHELRTSRRWKHFKDLEDGYTANADIEVASQNAPLRGHGAQVAVKTNTCISDDAQLLRRNDLLVATIYNPKHEDDSRLLATPFGVSERMLDLFTEWGLMEAFIGCKVEQIREAFNPGGKTDGVGFIGCGGYGRAAILKAARKHNEIDGYTYEVVEQQGMPIEDYCHTVSRWDGGLDLPGSHPKSYRFAELVLFGAAVIHTRPALQNSRLCGPENTVIVNSWGERFSQRAKEWLDIRGAATQDYFEAWSPLGQARQILERLT